MTGARSCIVAAVLVGASLLVPSVASADWAEPPRCAGVPATIWGSAAAETLEGTSGDDVIVGLGGADTIFGYGGDDLICGNRGGDVILGGPGADTLVGGPGDDVLFGAGGDDVLNGGDDDDLLSGGNGDDRLAGGDGDDRLLSGAGHDKGFGGGGGDVLFGFDGRDRLRGGDGDDAIDGGADRDRLSGDDGLDVLAGGDDLDRLRGGRDDDVLDGGDGPDLADGGKGADLCSGAVTAESCETVDPGMWDWLRTDHAGLLGDHLVAAAVLQTGCDTGLHLDRLRIAAGVFPDAAGTHLQAAASDLTDSADACNIDEASWRGSLRDALVHLEDFNAVVTGGKPEPVGALATASEAAPAAVDVVSATLGHLEGGNPPQAETPFWWKVTHPGRARQLAVAADVGGFDVVFVGSSTIGNGIDPGLFTTLDGRTSYNAALGGSGPEIQAAFTLDEIVPSVTPDLVVLGVEDRAFRGWDVVPGSCAAPTDDWFAARALRAAAFGPVDALAGSDGNALFFGDPATTDPTRPLQAFSYFASTHGPLGESTSYPADLTLEHKLHLVGAIHPWSIGYEPCEERIDAAVGLVASLVGAGVDVVVVVMPHSDVRAGAFDPEGEGDPVAGRAVLDAVFADVGSRVEAAGADVLDLSDHPSMVEELFRDTGHLNAEGAAVLTALLAGELAALP